MKPIIASLFCLITVNSFSQCPFLAALDSTSSCIGSRLTVNTPTDITKIEWYNGGTKISTTLPGAASSGITVAGGNGSGANNNQLNFPSSVYVDAAGNMYISDVNNHRVQLWLNGAASGSTVAGGNGFGFAANQLSGPQGVFVDPSGNVYVSDYGNLRVQKWAPGSTSGVTVAGGNGSGSNANQFDFPVGLFVDAANNVYVADDNNHRIQKWTPGATSGVTVAGGNGAGSAPNQINYAMDVFVDNSGNVYVADVYNNRVQKWAPGATSGITVAGGNGPGNAANQLFQPYAIWVDNAGNVYVCDTDNNRVQKWAPGATNGVTVAGGNGTGSAANQFNDPRDIFVDASGNVYVADQQNGRVQKWPSSNIDSSYVTTAAGSYSALVTDKNGCVMTTNKVTIYPTLKASIAITSSAIVTNSCGTLLFNSKVLNAGVSPQYQWRVNGVSKGKNSADFSYSNWQNGDIVDCVLIPDYPCPSNPSETSNRITIIVGAVSTIDLNSSGLCLGDTLFISTLDSLDKILWYNGNGLIDSSKGVSTAFGITVAGGNGQGTADNQLNNPGGIFLDKNGDLYITDSYNNRILKWTPGAASGAKVAGQSTIWGSPNLNSFELPVDVLVDAIGNIYVSDKGNGRIQKWTPGATTGIKIAPIGSGQGPDQLSGPHGIIMDAAGNLYIVDQGNDRVQMWPPGASSGITVAGGHGPGNGADQLDTPVGITIDSKGNIYVADLMNSRVQMWAPGASSGVTVAGGNGQGGAANQLNNPDGVCVDKDGNVYVLEYVNHRVQKWAPGASTGVTVAGGNGFGSAANQLNYPTALLIDGNGDLYISDLGNNRIQKWPQHYRIDTTYVPLEAGSFTAVVTNSSGCTLTSNTINIYPKTKPTISISGSADTVCSGAPVVFTATEKDGGVSPVYKWMVNGISKGSNSSIYTTNTLLNGDAVSCILSSNSPCASSPLDTSNSINITVINPSLAAVQIAASDTVICQGDEIVFKATSINAGNNVNYQWKVNGTNAGNGNFFTSRNINDGDVIVCSISGTNECGSGIQVISNGITIKIKQISGSVHITSSSNAICSNQAANFEATAIVKDANTYSYKWSVNGVQMAGNSPIFNAHFSNGDIIVCKVKTDITCGILESNNIVIKVYDSPTVGDSTYTVSLGQSVMLNPVVTGVIKQYVWSPAIGLSAPDIKNPISTPQQNTTYQLEVLTQDGCIEVGTQLIKVFTHLYIPNAFTPNRDGRNDLFYLLGSEAGTIIKDFTVFNRWGQVVFNSKNTVSDDPASGWDGYYKGEPSPSGVYIYQIRLATSNGKEKVLKGHVTLLR